MIIIIIIISIIIIIGPKRGSALNTRRNDFIGSYILRRIWRLPRNCHTRILHKIAHLNSVFNRLIRLSDCFSRKTCESNSYLLYDSSRKTCESNSYLLRDSFTLFNTNVFTPVGSNRYCAHKYVKSKSYFEEDLICDDFARYLRISNSSTIDLDIESMIQIICCN